jgi:hypothetical protein
MTVEITNKNGYPFPTKDHQNGKYVEVKDGDLFSIEFHPSRSIEAARLECLEINGVPQVKPESLFITGYSKMNTPQAGVASGNFVAITEGSPTWEANRLTKAQDTGVIKVVLQPIRRSYPSPTYKGATRGGLAASAGLVGNANDSYGTFTGGYEIVGQPLTYYFRLIAATSDTKVRPIVSGPPPLI